MSQAVQWVHDTLQGNLEDKWGWVIYRTTYKDDAAWERFRDSVNMSSRGALREQGASPLVLGALDYVFVSDPTLEGASREQLRTRFRKWRKPAIQAENPRRPLPKEWDEIPARYVYFVHVDEDSLNSVVQARRRSRDSGWVHFVFCDQEVDLDTSHPKWRWYDDHWKMLSSWMISAEFYDEVWNTIFRWDVGPSIEDRMEWHTEQLEKASAEFALSNVRPESHAIVLYRSTRCQLQPVA